jgi:hypothetical protein
VQSIADPRIFPLAARDVTPQAAHWYSCAERAFGASTGQESAAADTELRRQMIESLLDNEVDGLTAAFNSAPSAVIHRHLLRALRSAWSEPGVDRDATIVAHGFAMPIVIIAAADAAVELAAILDEPAALASLIGEHRGLGPNRSFALANVLSGASAVGIDSLRRWLVWRRSPALPERDIAPSPIRIGAGQQGAHLRFLVGSALAAPGAELFDDDSIARWGMPFARELSRQLARPRVQLLALPRALTDPIGAWQAGLQAHREIALQLFTSQAIRSLRAAYGEPTAGVSAHRIDRNGELRLSLSSVFGENDAEGFRFPLFAFDRIDDALSIIVGLLRECRVDDIRIVAGVHEDYDAATGLPLFFRADALARSESVPFH